MSRITIMEYKAAKGGDYDYYKLSNGEVYWLWLKAPFKGGEAALVHVVADDDKEIGTVFMEKDIGTLKMHLEDPNGKIIRRAEVEITLLQDMKPNKKYYFDKIVRNLLIK